MPEPLAPKLKRLTVKYERLVLDPNNPRFTTRSEDQIAEEHYLDQDNAGVTLDKMYPETKDSYKIAELMNSIMQNGWLPVDNIFVRKLKGHDNRYVVLEGNRRVVAIRKIMIDPTAAASLKKALESIDVMEVLDSGSPQELQKKITYLLGVRHHGSLKRWTAFAQAHNIFNRYLEVSGQTPESFEWNEKSGEKVADTLSIQTEDVKDRLKVYRVMDQIGNSSEVKHSRDGGMKDRYYSICAEPLQSSRTKLGSYIFQDQKTFLLQDEGVTRMNNLCHFDKPSRDGAPIHNPQEWGDLAKILEDEDKEKKTENLRLVESEKRQPSEVWAPRAKELTKATWEKLLFETNSILKTVTLIELTETSHATATVKKLIALVDQLDRRDIH